jgi:hypothetical protein
LSPKQHAGQNQSINIGNKSFDRERHLMCLETTQTNQNSTHEGKKETEVRDFLLFGAESFVFQFAVQKYKDQDIQNCNFARFLV